MKSHVDDLIHVGSNGIYVNLHNESGAPQALVICLKSKHIHKHPYDSAVKKTFMSLTFQYRSYFLVHYKTILILVLAHNQLPDNLSLTIPNFAHFMLPFQALGGSSPINVYAHA